MPGKRGSRSNYAKAINKVEKKEKADPQDISEEADVDRSKAAAEAMRETVLASRALRRLRPAVLRKLFFGLIIWFCFAVMVTLAGGFHFLGFSIDNKVLISIWAFGGVSGVITIVGRILK